MSRSTFRGRLAAMLLTIFTVFPLMASSWSIPDNAWARRQLIELIQEPVSRLDISDGRVLTDEFSGALVKFEIQKSDEQLYLVFLNEKDGSFPTVGAGNMIIRRNLADGSINQIKLFLDDIGALVVRISPSGRRSLMSLSLFDDELYTGLPLNLSMRQLLERPAADFLRLSSGRIPWDRLLPPDNTDSFSALRTMLSKAREVLPHLPDSEDGAMDAEGNLVLIETLGLNQLPGFNCSGFAKYVCDGLYYQLTGNFMDIEELKTRHSAFRGNDISLVYEHERDPYFGLDWTRNIAVQLASLMDGMSYGPEAADLRSMDFYPYQEDMGYPIDSLIQVLYLQTIREPGLMYLGSVNGLFGSDPVLWQHYHVAVFYPFFDEEGNFRIAVLERNVETSVRSLEARYPETFIHLVKIHPLQDYEVPPLPVADRAP